MEVETEADLQVISRDLVPSIKGAMSVTVFKYDDVPLAFLIVLTEEEDRTGYVKIMLEAFKRHGYATYSEDVSKNGLRYYLTCLNAQEDDQKALLVQSIKNAYDQAEYFMPVIIELSGNIDFKALTLDGKEVSNDIFKSKAYTIINIWATTCILCIEILPELIKWEKELPEDVQVLYLTAEKEGLANLDRADFDKKIRELGLNPNNVLLYDNGFSKTIDTILSATPTTLFVDTGGNIIDDIIIGSDINKCRSIAEHITK